MNKETEGALFFFNDATMTFGKQPVIKWLPDLLIVWGLYLSFLSFFMDIIYGLS